MTVLQYQTSSGAGSPASSTFFDLFNLLPSVQAWSFSQLKYHACSGHMLLLSHQVRDVMCYVNDNGELTLQSTTRARTLMCHQGKSNQFLTGHMNGC